MKIISFSLTLLVLVTGCLYWPEIASEHDESNEFWRNLNSDLRIAAIFAHKPHKRFCVMGNSREITIIINSRTITQFSFTPDVPDRLVPGNQYTPEEVAVIEDVALDIKAKLGIKREIMVFDESTKKLHKAKRLPPATKPLLK